MEKVRLELTPLGLETQCADRYTTPPFCCSRPELNRYLPALLWATRADHPLTGRATRLWNCWRLGNVVPRAAWKPWLGVPPIWIILSCAADVVTHPRFELGTYRLKADYSASWVNGWFGGVAASQHWKELPTCVGGGGLGIRTRGDQPHSTPLLRFPTRLILHAYYGFYKSYTIFLLRCLKRHNVGQEPKNFRLFFLSY